MPLKEGYPHPELLETSEWLAEHLKEPDIRVLDFRLVEEYEAGRIPGSVMLPQRIFKAKGSRETCSAQDFASAAGEWGVKPTDTVVCVDNGRGPSAARVWWAFARFGQAHARFLNGGMRAWKAGGFPLSTEVSSYPPVTYQLNAPRDDLACSLPQAIEALNRKDVVFWDSRYPLEYSGDYLQDTSPERAGRIPGAVLLLWSDLLEPGTGLFKPLDEMRRILEAKGITPDKEIIAYDHGGRRAAHCVLSLKLLGYPRARNFDGSFGAWAQESDAPVER